MSEAVSATGILVKRAPLESVSTIVSSSIANPSLITLSAAPAVPLVSGQTIAILGHVGSTPAINASHVITVVTPTTFTIPINVTVGGTGGTATLDPDDNLVTLAELTDVTPPGWSRNKIPTSTHNDGTESNILGILRQKDPSATINWVGGNATHDTLLEDMLTNRKATWQFLFPSGISLTGPGYVMQFEPADVPVDAAQQAAIQWTWGGPIAVVTP